VFLLISNYVIILNLFEPVTDVHSIYTTLIYSEWNKIISDNKRTDVFNITWIYKYDICENCR